MDYVRRIVRLSDMSLSARVHASHNDVTLCGIEINDLWYVIGDAVRPTCPQCKIALPKFGQRDVPGGPLEKSNIVSQQNAH